LVAAGPAKLVVITPVPFAVKVADPVEEDGKFKVKLSLNWISPLPPPTPASQVNVANGFKKLLLKLNY
jgi:hypothetical protein